MTKQERQEQIKALAKTVAVKVPTSKGGLECIVASSTVPGKFHTVTLDHDYHTVHCGCMDGTQYDCKHKQAVRLYFSRYILNLRNNEKNPVYQFRRNGIVVKARVSQMSKSERIALKEWKRQEAENNQRRARMHDVYDVNMVA